MKKILSSTILSGIALATIASFAPVSALEPSDAELEKMFTVLINDEYKAQAEYEALIEEFGAVNPFARIVKAEARHIDALETLFDAYDFDIPEDNGDKYAVVPDSLEKAYAIGVEAEIANIDLYEDYLKQDLPEDVERVFTNLMKASENHLRAFENAVDGNIGIGEGSRGNDDSRGNAEMRQTRTEDCDLSGEAQALNENRQTNQRKGRNF